MERIKLKQLETLTGGLNCFVTGFVWAAGVSSYVFGLGIGYMINEMYGVNKQMSKCLDN